MSQPSRRSLRRRARAGVPAKAPATTHPLLAACRSLLAVLALILVSGCASWETVQAEAEADANAYLDPNGQFVAGFAAGLGKGGAELVQTAESARVIIAAKGAVVLKMLSEGDWDKAKGLLHDVQLAALDGAIAIGQPTRELIEQGMQNAEHLLEWRNIARLTASLLDDARSAAKVAELTTERIQEVYREVHAKGLTEVLGEVVSAIDARIRATSFPDVYALISLGEWEELLGAALASRIPESVRVGVMMAIDYFEVTGERLAGLTPFKKGVIIGYITFQFIPLTKAVDAVKAGSRLLKVNQKSAQLRAMGARNADNMAAAWAAHVGRVESQGWCFPAGTPVRTAQGSTAIERIQPGDWVLAGDPETGATGLRRVEETFVSVPWSWVDITYVAQERFERYRRTLTDAGGAVADDDSRVLTATPDHGIWCEDAQDFIPARLLEPGMRLRLADGRLAHVVRSATRRNAEGATSHNLAVEGVHTYFAGPDAVWVHNREPRCRVFLRLVEKYRERGIQTAGEATITFREPAFRTIRGFKDIDKEWYAAQHIFGKILSPPGKPHKFTVDFVKTINQAFARKAGAAFFTPASAPYRAWKNVPRPATADAAHYWPRTWMQNPLRYEDGAAFMQARGIHTRRIPQVVGNDPLFNDWMVGRLQKAPFTFRPMPATATAEQQLKQAQAWFKVDRNITPAQRLDLVRTFWREILAIDPPANMLPDGLLLP